MSAAVAPETGVVLGALLEMTTQTEAFRLRLGVTPKQLRMLFLLAGAAPEPVSVQELKAGIYNMLFPPPSNAVVVLLSRMREALARAGGEVKTHYCNQGYSMSLEAVERLRAAGGEA